MRWPDADKEQTMNFLINLLTLLGIIVGVVALAFLPWIALLVLAVALAAWMAFTRRGQQSWSVTRVGIATIPQRLGSSAVVVVGIAGVVGVLVALLAMGEGFQATLKGTGTDDTAVVIRSGALSELNSVLSHDAVVQIEQATDVLKDAQGQAIASAELVVVASLLKKSNGLDANVEIRGVGAQVWALRPNVKLTTGRKFTPGLRELVVGKGATQQFTGTDLGSTLVLNNQTWTVVGTFESGDAFESEMWGDADIVASTYRRGDSVTDVTVRLTSAGAFDAFKAALASNPQLTVETKTTSDYFSAQSEGLARLIRIIGTTIGLIMGIGAVFGALNTMYAAVSARAREIATLRAIGFRGLPVVVSVLLETMLLALLGGALGAAVAWLIFDKYTVSTLGSNFSQVVFAFKVSPALVLSGLKWALAIGLIGGLFPSLRAARVPVTTALREL
jgi:putative ABC transport system permease protein